MQRIGFLRTTSSSPPFSSCFHAFRQGLRELGWIEGRNTAIEFRTAEDMVERLPALAGELVRLNVKLIVADANAEIAAVKGASGGTIPIVSISMSDPIGSGFIASYAHPGGDVTGLTSDVTQQEPVKRLELFREAAPNISRVRLAAERLGLTFYPIEVRNPDDLDRVFADMRRERTDAVSVVSGGILSTHRERVITLAMQGKLPTLSYDTDYPTSGRLMSYGPGFGLAPVW